MDLTKIASRIPPGLLLRKSGGVVKVGGLDHGSIERVVICRNPGEGFLVEQFRRSFGYLPVRTRHSPARA